MSAQHRIAEGIARDMTQQQREDLAAIVTDLVEQYTGPRYTFDVTKIHDAESLHQLGVINEINDGLFGPGQYASPTTWMIPVLRLLIVGNQVS